MVSLGGRTPAERRVRPVGVLAEKARFGAKAYTDEASVYNALDAFFDHESVNHSAGEYVR